uniref:Peptidase S74 domain-containing protein n=1 Tax=Rhizochromulina marina TaxID=1034831 RepID=A0A7S2WWA7_9STRA
MSAVTAQANSPRFKGSLLRLEAAPEDGDFMLIDSAVGTSKKRVFSVTGKGHLRSTDVSATGQLLAESDLKIGGRAAFQSITVAAGETIAVGAAQSLVQITDDGVQARNELVLSSEAARDGQVLLISNGDAQATTGAAEIPAQRSVLFLFSEAKASWVPLTTLDSRNSRLEGVTSFRAANNLDIGPVTLKAQQLVAAGQVAGQVALYGAGGLLVGDDQLTFDVETGTLRVSKLSVSQVDSPSLDLMGSPVKNLRVESGSASGLTSLRSEQIYVGSLQQPGSMVTVDRDGQLVTSKFAYVNELDGGVLVVQSLRLQDLAPQADHLAVIGPNGKVQVLPGLAVAVDSDSGGARTVLQAPALRAGVLQSPEGDKPITVEAPLDLGGQELRRATIVDSTLTGLDELGVKALTLSSAAGLRLAFFTANSSLTALESAAVDMDGVLHLSSVKVKHLAADLDASGNSVLNAVLKSATVESADAVAAESLRITRHLGEPGGLVFAGRKGELEVASGATYDAVTETLHAKHVGAHTWKGDVDAAGATLKNARLIRGAVQDAEEVSTTGKIVAGGELEVGGDAQLGGSLFVAGTVMGSGPYVDSSDRRFKTNIRPLNPGSALETLHGLRPVRYEYNRAAFPSRGFTNGTEIGLVAQDVEEVAPELVVTDRDGFKYVSYARIGVLATHALQEMAQEIQALRTENARLAERVAALEASDAARHLGTREDHAKTTAESLLARLEILERRVLTEDSSGVKGEGN